MTLDYILETPLACCVPGGRAKVMPPIVCKDGFTVSVQASSSHYCAPRDNFGPWRSVELGYPSEPLPESFLEAAEDPSKPLETVYGYVPVEMVRELIASHGGEVTE